MKSKSKNIALAGIWSALIFVVLLVESVLGKFVLPVLPPAIISFAVMLTLCLIGDWKYALTAGTILGVSSMICAFVIGNEVFINPLISVVPRILMGLVAYGVYELFRYLFRNAKSVFVREILPISLGAAFGIFTNTGLVLGLIAVVYQGDFFGSLVGLFQGATAINFPLEFACSVILTPVLVRALRRALKLDFGKKYGSEEQTPCGKPEESLQK